MYFFKVVNEISRNNIFNENGYNITFEKSDSTSRTGRTNYYSIMVRDSDSYFLIYRTSIYVENYENFYISVEIENFLDKGEKIFKRNFTNIIEAGNWIKENMNNIFKKNTSFLIKKVLNKYLNNI